MDKTRNNVTRRLKYSFKVSAAVAALFAMLVSGIISSCTAADSALTASQQAAKAAVIQDMLESRDYTIEVESANPLRGRIVSLTGIYELKVSGDDVVSYLPYFGRAYRTSFGIGSPLDFNGQITNYKQERARKDMTRITFDTRNDDESITYRIEVFDDGRATVDVTSMYRERISFDGRIDDAHIEYGYSR